MALAKRIETCLLAACLGLTAFSTIQLFMQPHAYTGAMIVFWYMITWLYSEEVLDYEC